MSFQIQIDKQIKSGSIYFVGDALPPDWYAGFKSWRTLAEQGDMKAQLNVGWCYLYGEGVDGSRQQSKAWFLKAAAQECPKAHWYLSRDYFGDDEATRAAYFEKAIVLGDKLALAHQKEVQEKAEADRVIEVRRLANEAQKEEQRKKTEVFQAVLAEIVNAFDEENYSKAKSLLDAAIAGGHSAFTNLRANLDISLESISVGRRAEKGNLVSGGMVNGTTQTYQRWDYFLDVEYTLTNASAFPADVMLRSLLVGAKGDGDEHQFFKAIPAGESKSFERSISPQAACSLLPFTIVSAGGHNFRVPLKGFSAVQFPSCEMKLKNAGCFVLTACFDDQNHPTVVKFRDFRDTRLSESAIGRSCIEFYYDHGPKAAAFVRERPQLKKVLRLLFGAIRRALPR